MKYSLILLAVLFTFMAQAKKERALKIEIYDIYSSEVISKATVKMSYDDVSIEMMSDERGKVLFEDIPGSVEKVKVVIKPINHEEMEQFYFIGKKGVFNNRVYLYPLKKNTASNDEAETLTIPESGQDTVCSKEFEDDYFERCAELLTITKSNIQYPIISIENEDQGRVVINFIIEPNGAITNIEVTQRVSPELDREAIRVVRSIKRTAAIQCNDIPVRVKCSLPIVFRIY